MTKYQVLKNFQSGEKGKRVHYFEGDIFIGDPNDALVKELIREKRIEELSIALNRSASELKKKSEEAEAKAKLAIDKAKKAEAEAKELDKKDKVKDNK